MLLKLQKYVAIFIRFCNFSVRLHFKWPRLFLPSLLNKHITALDAYIFIFNNKYYYGMYSWFVEETVSISITNHNTNIYLQNDIYYEEKFLFSFEASCFQSLYVFNQQVILSATRDFYFSDRLKDHFLRDNNNGHRSKRLCSISFTDLSKGKWFLKKISKQLGELYLNRSGHAESNYDTMK